MIVELLEIFGRYPVLAMRSIADLLNRVPRQELRIDGKTKNVTAAVALHIPTAGDLHSILVNFRAHWL